MRTTDHSWRRVLTTLSALAAAAIVLDIALSFALCPYGGLSETIWSEYRETPAETIDTVFLGSSYGHRDIDPARVDEALGSSSFNLSTPGQTLASSHQALQRVAENPSLKRVVLCAGFETFAEKPNVSASIAFTQAMVQGDPLPEALGEYLRLVVFNPAYLGNGSSVAALFPWTYSRVPLTPAGIAGNIENRLRCATPREAAPILDPNITFAGRGFATYEGASDMSLSLGRTAAERYGATGASDENLAAVDAMARLCAGKGIDFVLLITPRPAQELLSRGEAYPLEMARVQAVVEAAGGTFIDFAMADPAFYEPAPSELYDYEHLNLAGAERFSSLLGAQLAQDDPHAGLIPYDAWSTFAEAEHVYNFVSLDAAYGAGTLTATASDFAVPGQSVEYRFTVRDYATGEEIVDTGFTASPALETSVQGYKTLVVRVDARIVGSEQNPWSYSEKTVSS